MIQSSCLWMICTQTLEFWYSLKILCSDIAQEWNSLEIIWIVIIYHRNVVKCAQKKIRLLVYVVESIHSIRWFDLIVPSLITWENVKVARDFWQMRLFFFSFLFCIFLLFKDILSERTSYQVRSFIYCEVTCCNSLFIVTFYSVELKFMFRHRWFCSHW